MFLPSNLEPERTLLYPSTLSGSLRRTVGRSRSGAPKEKQGQRTVK